MTKLEFVREVFGATINQSINEMKDNKGTFSKYIDGQEYSLDIDFKVVDGKYILAYVVGDNPRNPTKPFRTYVDIEGTLFEGMLEIVLDSLIRTNYYFMNGLE